MEELVVDDGDISDAFFPEPIAVSNILHSSPFVPFHVSISFSDNVNRNQRLSQGLLLKLLLRRLLQKLPQRRKLLLKHLPKRQNKRLSSRTSKLALQRRDQSRTQRMRIQALRYLHQTMAQFFPRLLRAPRSRKRYQLPRRLEQSLFKKTRTNL